MLNDNNLSNKETDEAPNSQTIAIVHEVDGQLFLEDQDALNLVIAIGKSNCKNTFESNLDRISYFNHRVSILERSAMDTVIVIINVDSLYGADLADKLMPGHDWQQYRDIGEVPFARGLAERVGIQESLDIIDEYAAEKLRAMNDLAVVVVDYNVAEVFSVTND
ncbi:MAG: hypothetical protein WCQ49_03530 [Candidatus Saccharibacteria bacterium]